MSEGALTVAKTQSQSGQTGMGVLLAGVKIVGTGVGFVGFVAVAGAGVLWLRFHALGLPATYAISLVPRVELVAIGATFLAPAAALSLALMLVFGFFKWQVGLSLKPGARIKWSPVDVLGSRVGVDLPAIRAARQTASADVEEHAVIVNGLLAKGLPLGAAGEAHDLAIFKLQVLERGLGDLQKAADVGATALVAVLTLAVSFYFGWMDGLWVLIVLVLASVIATVVAWFSFAQTVSVGWSMVAMFAVFALYMAGLEGMRTYHAPKLETIAIDRSKSTTAMRGALVTQTDTYVYLAQGSARSWSISAVPRSDVTDEAIGPLTKVAKIDVDAQRLLLSK